MLQELIKRRQFPPVTGPDVQKKRAEMLELLSRYSYGFTPEEPVNVSVCPAAEDQLLYEGKTRLESCTLTMHAGEKAFSFPFVIYHPVEQGNHPLPVILFLSGHGLIGDLRDAPAEETTAAGFILVQVYFADIVNDHHYGDFSDGLAVFFGMNSPRCPDEWGKIGMWAYGASRVMDYLQTRTDMDHERIILAGHSRLGKTVLWAAAQDERFFGVIDNASGYGGAATSRYGTGEKVTDFLRAGSWDWFCENFKNNTGEKENTKPYDQAMLLALIAPRYLCIGTADADADSDPVSIYLTALYASAAWKQEGCSGLVVPDRLPHAGDVFHEGTIGFHMRSGKHALTKEDWNHYLDFYRKKTEESKHV